MVSIGHLIEEGCEIRQAIDDATRGVADWESELASLRDKIASLNETRTSNRTRIKEIFGTHGSSAERRKLQDENNDLRKDLIQVYSRRNEIDRNLDAELKKLRQSENDKKRLLINLQFKRHDINKALENAEFLQSYRKDLGTDERPLCENLKNLQLQVDKVVEILNGESSFHGRFGELIAAAWLEPEDGGQGGCLVDLKISSNGETLIANYDVNQGNGYTFDSQIYRKDKKNKGVSLPGTRRHDHAGDGKTFRTSGNITGRGFFTGPGSANDQPEK